MKKYLITILIFCFTAHCNAQENFEGVIKYNLNIENLDAATWFSLKVYFKQHKVLMQSFSGEDSTIADHEKLFDFDSGFSYEIDRAERTMLQDSLNKVVYKTILPLRLNDSIKNIMDYECRLTRYDSININEERSEDVNLWFAENLKFDLPENYYPFAPCLTFTNGKNICLSAYLSTVIYRNGKARLNLKAVTIDKMLLPDSIFLLPKDFVLTQMKPANNTKVKISVSVTKGENDPPPPPPPPPPKKKTGKKPITTTKTVKTTSPKGKQ